MLSKTIFKKVISLICVFSFLFYVTPAYGSEPTSGGTELDLELKNGIVTQIKKGDPAPFSGILLSTTAAAKLYGELRFFEEDCKLTLDKSLEIQRIKYDTEVSALKLKLDVEIERTEKLLEIKDRRIEFLEKNWKPTPWYESGEFWVAVGVVSGVLLTVGSAYAIGQASK